MPISFTSPRISFPLVLLALLTMPPSGQAQSAHPVRKSSPSKSGVGNLAAKTILAKQDEGQSSDPVQANLDALNALKSGQPSRSLLALSSTQQVLFQEDFSHPDSMAQRWSWSANDGTLIFQNHCLELSAKGYHFPVIQTLNDPFPATGDWTVSIGYKYTGETVCGTDLKIARLDGSNLPDLACIHEDNNGQFLSIDGAGQVWRQSPNQDWHVLTLSKQGSRIKTIMDGKAVADSDAGAAPVGFRFGNLGAVGWDATWTSQQIRFVEVTAPRAAIAATPSLVKSSKNAVTAKLVTQRSSFSSSSWSTEDGSQFLEANDTAAHLKPRVDGKGPRTVTATYKLRTSDIKVWQVASEIRFGNLQDQASSFHLTRGGQDVGWIGADGFNKGIGVFIGKDNQIFGVTADAVWHHLSYKSDGNSLIVMLDGKQVGTGPAQPVPDSLALSNSQDMAVPCHQEGVWVRNVSVQSGAPSAAPEQPSLLDAARSVVAAPLFLPPQPRPATTIDLAHGDDNICCVLGDTVHLFGQSSGKHRLTRHAFEVNGQPYTDQPAGPNDNDYSFTWKPDAPGTYHLAVKYTLQQPYDLVVVKEATLVVLPKRPVALNQFAQALPTDAPASVQPLDASVFHLARIEYSLDGHSAGVAAQAPFQATLPISKLTPGQYDFTYQAYDAQGLHYQGESQTITIPERVVLALPSLLTITAEKEKTPLSVQLTPGLKVTQVNYFVGDQQVASSTQTPYNASADLAPYKSGAYDLKAQVVTSDFGSFSSPTLHLNLTNHPDDDRLTRLAKKEADYQAALQRKSVQAKSDLITWFESPAIDPRNNIKLLVACFKLELAIPMNKDGIDNFLNSDEPLIRSFQQLAESYSHCSFPASLSQADQETLKTGIKDAINYFNDAAASDQQYEQYLQILKIYGNKIEDIPAERLPIVKPLMKIYLDRSVKLHDTASESQASWFKNFTAAAARNNISNTESMFGTSTDNPAPAVEVPQASRDTTHEADQGLDLLVSNTKEAIKSGQVSVTVKKVTEDANGAATVDFAIFNTSKKQIFFWTTPTFVFADGTSCSVQSGSAGHRRFLSPTEMMGQILSQVGRSGPFEVSEGAVISRPEDTLINPGQLLYFHCDTQLPHVDTAPTKITFKGGGWDSTVLIPTTWNDPSHH